MAVGKLSVEDEKVEMEDIKDTCDGSNGGENSNMDRVYKQAATFPFYR